MVTSLDTRRTTRSVLRPMGNQMATPLRAAISISLLMASRALRRTHLKVLQAILSTHFYTLHACTFRLRAPAQGPLTVLMGKGGEAAGGRAQRLDKVQRGAKRGLPQPG